MIQVVLVTLGFILAVSFLIKKSWKMIRADGNKCEGCAHHRSHSKADNH